MRRAVLNIEECQTRGVKQKQTEVLNFLEHCFCPLQANPRAYTHTHTCGESWSVLAAPLGAARRGRIGRPIWGRLIVCLPLSPARRCETGGGGVSLPFPLPFPHHLYCGRSDRKEPGCCCCCNRIPLLAMRLLHKFVPTTTSTSPAKYELLVLCRWKLLNGVTALRSVLVSSRFPRTPSRNLCNTRRDHFTIASVPPLSI